MQNTIYNAHFGFRESPFGLTPDPQFFYSNAVYREALATLDYGLEARKGFVVLTGETGTGKTTLLRKLMRGFKPNFKTAYIFNTFVNFTDLLHLILTDLGLQETAKDNLTMIGRLNEYLLEQHKEGNIVALLIDEAQDLSLEILEQLRLLTNLETDKEKLLQIALIGQPELERKLSEPELRQLNQRVALRCRLAPLAAEEVDSYIGARLAAVGQSNKDLFDREAVERIVFYSHRIPRIINIICDNALLMAYAASNFKIGGKVIDEVAADLFIDPSVGGSVSSASLQAGENDFSRPVEEKRADHGTAETRLQTSQDEGLIPIAYPPTESHNYRGSRWLTTSPLLIFLLIGLGAFFYSQKTALFVRESSEAEIRSPRSEIEYAKMVPLRAEIPPSNPQVSSPTQNVFVDSLETAKVVAPSADESLHLQKVAAARVGVSHEKEFHQRPIPSVKQETVAVGNFDVVRDSFVRNTPRANADIIATLEPGTHVNVVGRNGDYYVVQSTGTQSLRGYVHREDAFFRRAQ